MGSIFAIHVDGENTYHAVSKRDDNLYLYFIYDLPVGIAQQRGFMVLNSLVGGYRSCMISPIIVSYRRKNHVKHS